MSNDFDRANTQSRDFTAQWTMNHLAVRAFVWSIVRDVHVTEDIVQEIALTAFDRFHGFEPGTNFKAWAFAIARNHVMNHQTRAMKDRHRFDETVLSRIAEAHAATPESFDVRLSALRECLGCLEGRQRRVLDAVYRGGLKAKQVAESEGMSPNAVYVLLTRVRGALLDCIRGKVGAGGGS